MEKSPIYEARAEKVLYSRRVTVIGLEEDEVKRRRRSLGRTIVWILSHVPGVLLIWWGIHIHQTQRIYLDETVSRWITGDEAVAFSWQIIGIGIGALAGGGASFWERPVLKWLLWIVAGAVFVYGVQQTYFK